MMTDVNQLFRRAEAAFGARRFAEARTLAGQVLRATGDHPAVLHLLALAAQRVGDRNAAEHAFARALQLAPRDAEINNNFANLLDELGRADEALVLYDRALSVRPAFVDARFNRGLLYQRIGRADDALREFDAVLAVDPGSIRAHSAGGSVLRQQARHVEAATAYDAALMLAPGHVKASNGRARVALEAGEAGASDHFRRALALQPDDQELTLGLAEALQAEGDPDALPFLAAAVAARPGWLEGQGRLSQMRAEANDPGHFARGYTEALACNPDDLALHHAYWRTLALAGRYDQALEAMNRARISEGRDERLMRAIFLGEAGRPHEGRDLLADLDDGTDVRTARARMSLRLGDWVNASRLFEGIVRETPDDIAAWAHLGIAWRLIDDARHGWLCEQRGLFGTLDLDLDATSLHSLAMLLRTLHRTRSHPIGQSLRGGTQTRGRLFWRGEPEIVRLRDAVGVAIRRFADALPPTDATHPMLRHRDRALTIKGSWSVRLTSSGFHVNHIHPQGVLSSACYVALPDSAGEDGMDGWLELGAPPVELGLPLKPLITIEPKQGWLALFPSYLYHGTRPFATGERLTVAFDVGAP